MPANSRWDLIRGLKRVNNIMNSRISVLNAIADKRMFLNDVVHGSV